VRNTADDKRAITTPYVRLVLFSGLPIHTVTVKLVIGHLVILGINYAKLKVDGTLK
jgi:hypothetical protein